jgi:hypothetical protein
MTKAQRASDVTWLAKVWEESLESIEYPTKKQAVLSLMRLIEAYFRGQNKRNGSWASFKNNQREISLFTTAVVNRVVDERAKIVYFPTLLRIGFKDLESSNRILRDVEW